MKVKYDIQEVDRATALRMIQTYHYSNTLPRINKHYIGFFLEGALVGVVTLGYGTRPKHTIQRLFPSLNTPDYLEIGRMCMTEEMPRCSESQMLAQLIRWIKTNLPEIKILFTWADGMLAKPGYVYQAANFSYIGYSPTDIYLLEGIKIHPRQTREFFRQGENDNRISCRPTRQQLQQYGIEHYRGRQYRYIYFLCNKREKRRLAAECTESLDQKPPKDKDLCWTRLNQATGKWEKSACPPYATDFQGDGADYVRRLLERRKEEIINHDITEKIA